MVNVLDCGNKLLRSCYIDLEIWVAKSILLLSHHLMCWCQGRTTSYFSFRCHSKTTFLFSLQTSHVCNRENYIPKYECRGCFGQGYILHSFGWLRYSDWFFWARNWILLLHWMSAWALFVGFRRWCAEFNSSLWQRCAGDLIRISKINLKQKDYQDQQCQEGRWPLNDYFVT